MFSNNENLIMCIDLKKGKFKNIKLIDYEKECYEKKYIKKIKNKK